MAQDRERQQRPAVSMTSALETLRFVRNDRNSNINPETLDIIDSTLALFSGDNAPEYHESLEQRLRAVERERDGLVSAARFALENLTDIAIPLAEKHGRVTSLPRSAELLRSALRGVTGGGESSI